jgi:uncharacterized protein
LVLDDYMPQAAWFHSPGGIHGLAHTARVLVWANLLAEALGADVEVVRWAAAVHDVGRVDDGRDPEHGERSATWWLNAGAVAPALGEAQRQAVASAVRWHVPWDDQVPMAARTPEWVCLKDADGLDRARLASVPVSGLDPRLLRTPHARGMVDLARALVDETRGGGWDEVRAAALRGGLWR